MLGQMDLAEASSLTDRTVNVTDTRVSGRNSSSRSMATQSEQEQGLLVKNKEGRVNTSRSREKSYGQYLEFINKVDTILGNATWES